MPSLHILTPSLPAKRNWKKTSGNRWTCFGVRVPKTWDYGIQL